jgi:lipoate-protein ligase A
MTGAQATWRLIRAIDSPHSAVPEPLAGALNMAVDQALFESVQAGAAAVLRLYRWSPPCLSLGRNQRAAGNYDPAAARALGIDIVRRPTGGLAVLHADELTYAVIAPAAPLGGPRAAYRAVNEALVNALRELGVPAVLGGGAEARAPSPDALHPCFERPAPGEVVALGRKLVGSAQRVERGAILQHGSILRTGTQDAVSDLCTARTSSAAGETAAGGSATRTALRGEITLAELLGTAPAWAALSRAVCRNFEARLGTALAPATLSPAERARAELLASEFGSDAWTWRR